MIIKNITFGLTTLQFEKKYLKVLASIIKILIRHIKKYHPQPPCNNE